LRTRAEVRLGPQGCGLLGDGDVDELIDGRAFLGGDAPDLIFQGLLKP
jgi:hypothetical protein